MFSRRFPLEIPLIGVDFLVILVSGYVVTGVADGHNEFVLERQEMRSDGEVFPPLKVPHVRLIIPVQEEQIICQRLGVGEIMYVNERVGGVELLIVCSWRTQNDWEGFCYEGPINLLCDVVLVD